MGRNSTYSEQGGTLVEFSLAFPILFLIALAFAEFGHVITIQYTLAHAVQQGLKLAQELPDLSENLDALDLGTPNGERRYNRFLSARGLVIEQIRSAVNTGFVATELTDSLVPLVEVELRDPVRQDSAEVEREHSSSAAVLSPGVSAQFKLLPAWHVPRETREQLQNVEHPLPCENKRLLRRRPALRAACAEYQQQSANSVPDSASSVAPSDVSPPIFLQVCARKPAIIPLLPLDSYIMCRTAVGFTHSNFALAEKLLDNNRVLLGTGEDQQVGPGTAVGQCTPADSACAVFVECSPGQSDPLCGRWEWFECQEDTSSVTPPVNGTPTHHCCSGSYAPAETTVGQVFTTTVFRCG